MVATDEDRRLAASMDALRAACLIRVAAGHVHDELATGGLATPASAVNELSALLDAATLFVERVRQYVDGTP